MDRMLLDVELLKAEAQERMRSAHRQAEKDRLHARLPQSRSRLAVELAVMIISLAVVATLVWMVL